MEKDKKHDAETNVLKSLDMREFKTNIKSLDRLLGYNEDVSNGTGIKPGDIIVAGKHFGCGSSREHAPIAIKACGISCIVAENFARIFYRNAINTGLPVVSSKEAASSIKKGDRVEVDTQKGTVRNISKRKVFKIEPYPSFVQKIIEKGRLLR